MENTELLIIGAGLSGLATAMHSDCDYVVLEKSSRPGGLLRTENIDGFLFDYTGHWLHIRDKRTTDMIDRLLPGQMLSVVRRAAIYSNKVMTLFPYQANLYGLPAEIVRECLQAAVESAVSRAAGTAARPKNFEEYANVHFGTGIAKNFIVPYNTKLWGVSPSEVTAEWTQRFVPVPDIRQIIDGALGFSAETMGYNVSFKYPALGGIETLITAMTTEVDLSKVRLNSKPSAISVGEKWVECEGRRIHWENLVSTAALPDLVAMTTDAPQHIKDAAAKLRCSPLKFINVALDVPRPLDGNYWIYLPEDRFPFYRVGVFSNAVPGLAPEGKSNLYVELANDRDVPESEVLESLKEFLKETGSIDRDEQIIFAEFRHHPWGYVIFDENCASSRDMILNWYNSVGVKSIGRYGAWTYNSMEDAILEGMDTAMEIGRKGRSV